MPETTVKDSVALTARWIAAARAKETVRSDAVFHDPYAHDLAGAEGYAFRGGHVPIAVSRTLFIDEFMEHAIQNGIRQIVLLAAGMDTRAFRLQVEPHTVVFEVDKPALFDVKETILESMNAVCLCDRRVVALDLEEEGWERDLLAAGFDRTKRTAWILEGLIYYIPEQAVHDILHKVSNLSAPGSKIVADMVNQDFMDSPSTAAHRHDMSERGAPWLFGHNNPKALFAQHQLDARAIDLNYVAVDRRTRRVVVDWRNAMSVQSRPFEPLTFYVTAEKM